MNTLPDHAMPTSATNSDPQYTEHGAIFPVVTVTPQGNGNVHLSISRPDGLDADAALTRREVLNIRDYLNQILHDYRDVYAA